MEGAVAPGMGAAAMHAACKAAAAVPAGRQRLHVHVLRRICARKCSKNGQERLISRSRHNDGRAHVLLRSVVSAMDTGQKQFLTAA